MAFLDVQDLSLNHSEQTVLDGVCFTVERGERLVIIGPSGSGKSSLLPCLNRLDEPAQGRILLKGDDIAGLPVIELRQRIGMIFQDEGTVGENINYGPTLRDEPLSREKIIELMVLAALESTCHTSWKFMIAVLVFVHEQWHPRVKRRPASRTDS